MPEVNYDDKNWFYIKNGRAMVSLGSLNQYKTCPYSCAFCYVQDGFIPYAKKNINEIVDFLIRHREKYDIIYVSGDTDSFAKPRTQTGISLLKSISENINCDLLFTTRTIFSSEDLQQLKRVVNTLKNKNKDLFACISITRFSDEVSYLEPYPIPSPQARIDTIKHLHNIGAVTVLALRPFLPIVKVTDYLSILNICKDYIDIALGEAFYFQKDGKIEKRVFPNGIPNKVETALKKVHMDFNENNEEWEIWESKFIESTIQNFCDKNDVIFSMHSADAINNYKSQKNLQILL